MKAPSVPGNIFASVKISEILSETKRKTERKARYAARTANTKTAQCARRLFSEGLAHAMFLLAVFIPYSDNISDKIYCLAFEKNEKIIQR